MPSVNRLTIDRTVDLWYRVGRREFTHHEVRDIVTNGAQLAAMRNRGYAEIEV